MSISVVKYDVRHDVLEGWLEQQFGPQMTADGSQVWSAKSALYECESSLGRAKYSLVGAASALRGLNEEATSKQVK
ncbi:hypothetical protein AUP68_01064 [Ilyonectria robusta]